MPTALVLALALLCAGCDRPALQASDNRVAGLNGALSGRVIDRADLLDPATEVKLAQLSEGLEQTTTDRLVIVTLDSLNGASIEQVGYGLGNAWGVGRADHNNGVLLLVAPNERKVRIETGTGLEGLLTDARAALIVRGMLTPFAAGDFRAGVVGGAQAIDRLLRSDPKRPQRKAA